MALDIHKVPQRRNHPLSLLGQFTCGTQNQHLRIVRPLIQQLQRRDGKHRRLSRTGLTLSNHIPSTYDGPNGTLLNRRGLFEAVGVYAAEEGGFEVHAVKGWAGGGEVVIGVVVIASFVATGGRAAKFICILAIVVAVPTTIAAFVMSRFIVYSIAATAMFGVFFVVGSVVAVVTAVMATGGAMGVILWH
eukprot:scaffold1164_cov191-Alexandrium_tamarense.AAC.3